MAYLAYELDEASRAHLLAAIPARYPDLRADHITELYETHPNPEGADRTLPKLSKARVIAVADDGRGIQVAVVRVGGWAHNLDGNFYHITLSFDGSKQVPESWTTNGVAETYRSRHSNCLLREVLMPDGWSLSSSKQIRRIDPPIELTVTPRWVEDATHAPSVPPQHAGKGLGG